MRRDPGLWLEDILTNGRDALEFLEGKTQEDYLKDKGLRAMVERKLFVVGEAATQLKNGAPEVAGRLPDIHEIVGFRNILVFWQKLDYIHENPVRPGLVERPEEFLDNLS
jgi:uncharacterized protein with HEPN domain